ncbi:MAG TPA: sigma 54-interacting transcriptional regulator, partial [Terriglobales bacterium]|nr:sigma 54-interacting transcriptional regulator [Terriglobales bacterium]
MNLQTLVLTASRQPLNPTSSFSHEQSIYAPECQWEDLPSDDLIFGHSATMASIRSRLRVIAGSDVPLLITGECGTGKELIARLIHKLSWARGACFVRVNCPGLRGPLFEAEIFGIDDGARTGAYKATGQRL